MSIAEELNRIQNAKSALKEAINAKGGTLGTETLEYYAQAVYCLKTEGTAVTSSPDFFKCVEVINKDIDRYYYYPLHAPSSKVELTYLGNESGVKIVEYASIDTEDDSIFIESRDIQCSWDVYTDGSARYVVFTDSNGHFSDVFMYHDQDRYMGNFYYDQSGNLIFNEGVQYHSVGYAPSKETEKIQLWTGNKAVLTDGVYTFEEAVTEGLTYGTAFIPEVGKIYNRDATVRVDSLFEGAAPDAPIVPQNGRIFYMPFNGTDEPVEGSVTSKTGEVSYGKLNGVLYAEFNGSQLLRCNTADPPGDSYTWAVSFRADTNSDMHLLDFREGNGSYGFYINTNSGRVWMDGSNGYWFTAGQWVNFIVSWDNGYLKCYMNGEVVREYDYGAHQSFADLPDTFLIGDKYVRGAPFSGGVFDVAIWNRVLTPEEIAHVASQVASMS